VTQSQASRDRTSAARNQTRAAIQRLALDSGAPVIQRPLFAGSDITVRDVEPLAGARAARDIEHAAQRSARDYIRQARETGHSWHQIGTALGLKPGTDAQQTGDTPAEAAFTYAAGHPDTHYARTYGRSITWTCTTCDHTITDHGLANGPADDERGHTSNCQRLAATIADRNAEWEAGQ
jgi:hypothetical protein